MFVHTNTAPRMTHWVVDLLIAALAFAIAVALTQSAWGQETAAKIPTVPPDQGYSSMAWADDPSHSDDYRTAMALVQIVDMHRANRLEEIETMWDGVTLPRETAVWKEVSLGLVNIKSANWKAAEAHFNEAARLAPHNPLPAYYVAAIRMHQADVFDDRFDAAGPDVRGLVKRQPPELQLPDAVSLRDEAIGKLLEAVDLGPVREVDRPLLNVAWVLPSVHSLEMPLTVPTVEDLMDAMGAANWATDAHWRLGNLLLAKGSLLEAEKHWDEAADHGMDLRLEYRELSRRHRAAGNGLDAVRCKLKSIRFGGPYLGT